EAQVQQLLERLIEQLPRGLARPPANAAEAVEPEPGKPGWRGSERALLGATIAAGSAVAAAVDRWAERRRR
ncbi:MAG: hypothetical protein WA695_01350, partial [Candidatus Dormiibacterota bacterium]